MDSVSIYMSVLYIPLNNLKYNYVHTYSSPKVCLVKAMGLPVVMYGCESWTIKKAEHQRSSLQSKEIPPVHLKEDQSWVFIGRTDVKAETPIL